MSASSDSAVRDVTDKLNLTQLDAGTHWEGFWDVAFGGDRE